MKSPQQAPDQNVIPSDLPLKITGIVFWGMVLVGLLIAFLMLASKEREIAAQNTHYAALVGRVLAAHINEAQKQDSSVIPNYQESLQQTFTMLQPSVHFSAITLTQPAGLLRAGEAHPTEAGISLLLSVNTSGAAPLRLTVYFPSVKHTEVMYRKQILISVGLVTMLFGLILQRILQRLLSQPFKSMVSRAQQFAQGDTEVRFDTSRSDEFGFLAKFINQALDSIVLQQTELRAALARTQESEEALAHEKERAEVTLQSIADAVITTNVAGEVQYLNPVAERLTGWSNADAQGLPVESVIQLVDEVTQSSIPNPIHECLKIDGVVTMSDHAALAQHHGQLLSIDVTAAPMRNDRGEFIGAVMVCQDVNNARKLALQLTYQASHDPLTGLYNRLKFEENLLHMLATTDASDQHALLYIDLDQFKIVNDTCGHMAGDELLRQLTRELKHNIRQSDTLARLGGDEFGVLLRNCSLTRAQAVADKIRQSVKEFRFAWHDKTFEIGASIGLVSITQDNLNAANIMSTADLACYTAKDGGRNRVHVFQSADIELMQRQGEMSWTTTITEALEKNRFVLYAQPIIGLSELDSSNLHWEVLVRIKDATGQIIPPNAFIPAAERYNKMSSIDRWVVLNVFKAIATGQHFVVPVGGKRVVAINLSGESLGDDEMLDYICTSAQQYGVSLHEICFEITETVAISNLSKATHFIRELKARGCRFSLDDFGSGLSSFGYLKNLAVDYIKIDGSFVKDMEVDPIDCAMVTAINQIGHVMQIKTIAEWVEDEATFNSLKRLGVNYAQGYHTGKPALFWEITPAAD
ncbi:MAG: EAL domain-containing protein [Sulfuriferula sp.]